jgi:hypothetical protein
MLRVIEKADPAPWASITDEMKRQAYGEAESLTQRFVAEVWAASGVTAERALREGDLKPEVRRLVDEDASIRLVVLASASGGGGPGPLVSSLAKGPGLGTRAVPVLVVPGALSPEEIRGLALSLAAPAGSDPPA